MPVDHDPCRSVPFSFRQTLLYLQNGLPSKTLESKMKHLASAMTSISDLDLDLDLGLDQSIGKGHPTTRSGREPSAMNSRLGIEHRGNPHIDHRSLHMDLQRGSVEPKISGAISVQDPGVGTMPSFVARSSQLTVHGSRTTSFGM